MTNVKVIKELGLQPSPFVSLNDRVASVFVDPGTRDILIDEGPGDKRANSVILREKNKPQFVVELDRASGARLLQIHYAGMTFEVGGLGSLGAEAEHWVKRANAYLERKEHELPAEAPAAASSAAPTASPPHVSPPRREPTYARPAGRFSPDGGVPATPPPAIPRPTRRDPLDADIEAEMQAVLAGLDEKSVYGAPAPRKPSGPQVEDRRKKGRVVSLHADDVFMDVGGRSQGVLPLNQFTEGTPKIGDIFDVEIEGYDRANGLLLLTRLGATQHVEDWASLAEGMIVEARVTGTNKGGLQVDVNGLRGFIPVSHIELFRVEDLNPYVNQRLRCMVTEVKPEERNLVLSRRALLDQERSEARERTWTELAEGQVRQGIVRSVKDFGAFIDIGGVDGLLHIGDMSWARIESPDKLLQIGQSVQVKVIKIDQEKKKLSLGMKQLGPSPWDDLASRISQGMIVPGKVTRIMEFGAFVELEPGIEGLVHISELSPQRVRRVTDLVKDGQEVQVKVLKVEPQQRRIALSIKATVAAPEPAATFAAAEPEQPETKKAPPPRKFPLKGGLGSR
jgi:small subunit ribosomal protein S1